MNNFTGLSATARGRTDQINRAYKGIARDLETKAVAAADCDEPQTIEQYKLLVTSLRLQLEEAVATNNNLRAQLYGDSAVEVRPTSGYLTTKEVARNSGVAVCTIIRNVDKLGGWQLKNGDWLFPPGTTYGRRRKAK